MSHIEHIYVVTNRIGPKPSNDYTTFCIYKKTVCHHISNVVLSRSSTMSATIIPNRVNVCLHIHRFMKGHSPLLLLDEYRARNTFSISIKHTVKHTSDQIHIMTYSSIFHHPLFAQRTTLWELLFSYRIININRKLVSDTQ